jgi:hypothetical protein
MSKVLSIGQINRFAKDDNNNLDKDSCLEFIKLYEKSNGKISSIENPITKRRLTDAKRIKFIYEKCLGYFNSKTPKPIKDKKVLYKLPKQIKDKKVLEKLTKQEFAIKIMEDPMLKTNDISKATERIYGKDNNANRLSFKKYLEDEDDELCKIYRSCVLEIKKYIKDFCPFMGNKKFSKSVKKNLESEYTNEDGLFWLSPKLLEIFDKINKSIFETIMYSPTNQNTDDFNNNLKNNFPKYYSLKYMLNIFENYSITKGVIDIKDLCETMDELIYYNKLIIKNKTNNLKIKSYKHSIVSENRQSFYERINISYVLNNKISIELFNVNIPIKFKKANSLIPKEYSFDILFKTIQTLLYEGKLLGKSMPYKMNIALTKYNNIILKDDEEYIDFCKFFYKL